MNLATLQEWPPVGWPLLAQRSNWVRLGERFSGSEAEFSSGDAFSIVAVCAAAAALIGWLHWMARREQSRASKPNPKRLFRELCETHGLSGSQTRLLTELAEAAGVRQPADVFVRPELFEPQRLPASLRGRRQELEPLADVLFADIRAPKEPSLPPPASLQEATGSDERATEIAHSPK